MSAFKRWFLGLATAFVLFFVVVMVVAACEGEDDPQPSPTPESVATSAATSAPTEECTNPEQLWASRLTSRTEAIGYTLVELGELMDSGDLANRTWQRDFFGALDALEDYAEQLERMRVAPGRLSGAGIFVTAAASEFDQGVSRLRRGVSNLDAEQIDLGATLLLAGVDSLTAAREIVESWCG